MTVAAVQPQAERFRALITRHMGLNFEDAKLGWLDEVLRRRVEAACCNSEFYLARLESGVSRDELRALAQELTVAETYFFRNIDQFRALREHVAPEHLRARAGGRGLRVLSAGCASGEEAYSIAMILRDLLPDPPRELMVRAVDVNPVVLEKARRARYTDWSLRETPPDMRQRWFRAEGRELVLDDSIRAAVSFEERNLNDDDPQLWASGAYDVVFCRNVLMYFAPQVARAAVARIARSLTPGGHLFLGHAETLWGLSHDFHLRHTHGSFYYQRKDGITSAVDPDEHQARVRSTVSPALVDVVDAADSWVEAIAQAAERVRALTVRASAAPQYAAVGVPEASQLGRVIELFREERYAQALDVVQGLPPESAHDPDMLLLHAVLLAHSGQFTDAENTCRRLLAIDELNAGAHYVLALCREGVGDRRGAAEHDQCAAYLDPAFAMPRLHLGLLARRAGDHAAVRRELGQALGLLQREDASRLLLFGGGFNRDALLALCRSELSVCREAAWA